MSTWSWNEIDVYVSLYNNVLGDASVATNLWVPLSNYGLLRGRVALTPSTVEGSSISIPGRDGNPYSKNNSRGNAKLTFELLIADEWIPEHKALNTTIRRRLDVIEYYLNNSRRIAYKQPGKEASSYFEVYKVKLTETDAYEEAATLKVEIEVNPFEFFFTGNVAVQLPKNDPVAFNVQIPFDTSRPSFLIQGGGDGYLYVTGTVGEFIGYNVPENTIVDTYKGLVYSAADPSVNRNAYFDGDFKKLWLYKETSGTITNTFSQTVLMYTRGGILR